MKTLQMYQQYSKQNPVETKRCGSNGVCAILRVLLGTNSAGPITGNGFDPRKHFPSKQGLIGRGGSWPSDNHHTKAF